MSIPSATIHRMILSARGTADPAVARRGPAPLRTGGERRSGGGSRIDGLLLELYRAATSLSPDRFNGTAMELLRSVLDFDAAWWGQMQLDPALVMQGAHLYNLPTTIFDDYRRLVGVDSLAQAMIAAPGATIVMNPREMQRVRETAGNGLREYLKRYQLEAVMATCQLGTPLTPAGFMTVWRFDRRWPFSEANRRIKQSLFPHMVEARRVNRLLNLESIRGADNAWALTDTSGHLFEVGADFIATVRIEWPEWEQTMLPRALARQVAEGNDFVGRRVRVSVEPAGRLQLLRARLSDAGDSLGRREREVAQAFAAGESYAAIAQRLALAPSTVRTHLQRIYRKLDVHTKSDLARRITR